MNDIFVFGSNLAGRHGKGAALFARQHRGAIYGQGEGLQGESYAIPTKDERLRTLGLPEIADHVRGFLLFARDRTDLTFQVTRIGCGLAGYNDEQIAPMFAGAPANCRLPEEWVMPLGTQANSSPASQSEGRATSSATSEARES